MYGHVITKFSGMGRLPHFLSYGALPTRALRARVELRYYRCKINQVPCDSVFVIIFYGTMYDKTTIRFGFCDILNNQGLGKCYQPWPLARLITLTTTLIILDITKTFIQ